MQPTILAKIDEIVELYEDGYLTRKAMAARLQRLDPDACRGCRHKLPADCVKRSCPSCLAKAKKYQRKKYEKRKANKECTQCGRPTLDSHVRCLLCLEAANVAVYKFKALRD